MEIFYVILIILAVAAITDLMVGVANDAVNFLNSAIGAKVAPRTVIMIVATAGILVGVTFSSGLMEIARKGIFNPEMLTFPEVMFIFAATMLTDVLLLDFFNTFGLPTSTTVSLVFELLGAAFAISLIKVLETGGGVAEALAFINTASVLKIVFGIILSVVAAFVVGSLAQYLSRMLFTFDLNLRVKRYGALWGGFALAILTYFLLVKGAKGASFLDPDQADWLKSNALLLAGASMLFWALVMQMLTWFTKVNIFKIVTLAGTFALAMAFAANDLVNFIGAPLAGLAAFEFADGSPNPLTMTMEALTDPVRVNTYLLLLAGIIMAITLWVNKKARTVTATSVNLGRQSEGAERFESNAAARSIVRLFLSVIRFFSLITPPSMKKWVEGRFDSSKFKPVPDENGEVPAFDMLRASVSLIVAALLVSIGTTLKLPLSTTYVTFMVAMATALPDRAWGRDSAVYRVAGVLTVIGGWFFTAIIASSAAAIVATIIYYTELPGLIGLTVLGGFLLFRSIRIHKTREAEAAEEARTLVTADTVEEAVTTLLNDLSTLITATGEILHGTNDGLVTENRLELREMREKAKQLHKRSKNMATVILQTSKLEEKDDAVEDRTYAEIMSSMTLLLRSLRDMTTHCYSHVSNNHQPMTDEQIADIHDIERELLEQLDIVASSLSGADFSRIEQVNIETQDVRDRIRKADKRQLKRSKKDKQTTRTSLLFLEMLTEYEEIIYHTRTIYELCRSCQVVPPPGIKTGKQQ
jgi:phosphate/sulfate permease